MAQHPKVAGELAEPETASKGEDDPLKCSSSEKPEEDENLLIQYSARATCASLPPCQQEDIRLSLDRKTCEVGRGAFGVVLKAKLAGGQVVALKKVRTDARANVMREVQVLIPLDHCNVIKLLYFFHKSQEDLISEAPYPTLTMVLEFVPHTLLNLLDRYKSKGEQMPLVMVKVLLCQLFQALRYLVWKSVVHRDIKPENILMHLETAVLKLGDFGLAKNLQDGEESSADVGTRSYRAPELLLGFSRYACSVDVWSAGCAFAEMLSLETPFFKENSDDQLATIAKVLGTPTVSDFESIQLSDEAKSRLRCLALSPPALSQHFPDDVPLDGLHLLSMLLKYNPTERFTPGTVLCHPFLDELCSPGTLLPNGAPLPPLHNES